MLLRCNTARKLDVVDALGRVEDEESFLVFLEALADDRADEEAKEAEHPSPPYGPGANGWENGTIYQFLESAAAFGRDSAKCKESCKPSDNPWRRCANIIYGGKVYE